MSTGRTCAANRVELGANVHLRRSQAGAQHDGHTPHGEHDSAVYSGEPEEPEGSFDGSIVATTRLACRLTADLPAVWFDRCLVDRCAAGIVLDPLRGVADGL